jgi:hypothetical protein
VVPLGTVKVFIGKLITLNSADRCACAEQNFGVTEKVWDGDQRKSAEFPQDMYCFVDTAVAHPGVSLRHTCARTKAGLTAAEALHMYV